MAASSLALAFAAGALSFFAPCVVPLLPAYVGYLAGAALPDVRADPGAFQLRIVRGGVLYVLGFGLVFVGLGVAAGFVGQGLRAQEVWVQRVGGVLVIAMGLSLLGLVPAAIGQRTFQPLRLGILGRSPGWTAFVLGLVFGTAWTPCVGPVLATILVLAANTHRALEGGILLTAYTLGLGLPFLLTTLLVAAFPAVTRPLQRSSAVISRVAGALLIGLGVLLLLGVYTQLAGYLALPAQVG
ncbi:MAG: cytochrome c biogenesis protein CcdA [Chloroflexi bacterium]|nr:MAG: cytochrome c biogenesis protein CcdA [Chloroflexota bacterium]